jgi:hypothetical protein
MFARTIFQLTALPFYAVTNGMTDNTNAERQRRYIAKLKAKAAVSNGGGTAKLVEELAQTKTKLAQAQAKITELQHEIIGQAQAFRDESKRRAAKPKAAPPPVAPEIDIDALRVRSNLEAVKKLETRVRSLTTANRNLRAELRDTQLWQASRMNASHMSFDTKQKIAKALHPDFEPTPAQREDAFKAFSQFTSGQRQAKATQPKSD